MIRDQTLSLVPRRIYINASSVLVLLCVTVAIADDGRKDETDPLERLEQTYREQAAGHEIYRDKDRSQELELVKAPVYKWADAQAKGRTGGMVFIWTWRGRPEAMAAIFSNPVEPEDRRITHEFHSLSKKVLRPATRKWKPQAGISTRTLSDAPGVAETATMRMAQMRSIARRFSGNTIDKKGERWEMRFLPQPLYRYATSDDDKSDGAVFAFVTSALTDPEAILLLETVRADDGYKWGYSILRFSYAPTYVRYNDAILWKSIPETPNHNQDRTYQLIQQPLIKDTWK